MESNNLQSDFLSRGSVKLIDDGEKRNSLVRNSEGFIGVLDVYIHEARDIQNICIYQNQDVYAKLCLTSDPERTISTQIINGGGRNPIFDENVRLNVQKIDSSLKVEIWMLSRVKNYLEDQLLGFTSVPLRDVLIGNGKPAQEFSLSSSDFYHSPAGFVQLTLTYTGASPEVLEIPASNSCSVVDVDGAIPCEVFDEIEFPDPNILKENEQMASEYFEIPCSDLDCESTEHDGQPTCDNVVCSQDMAFDRQASANVPNAETPPNTSETTGSPSVSVPKNPSSVSHATSIPGSEKQDDISELKGKNTSEVKSVPVEIPAIASTQPIINVTVERETKVVQEEIVEMYMKSMQQFTEALAKMKLPMDIGDPSSIDNADGNSGSSGSDEKSHASKGSEPSPKVFYGSGAFF